MQDEHDRRATFESRLVELKQRMEAGLMVRAQTLREAVARLLAGDETARRVIKHESHKLRGIAGTYGHEELTELAAELEMRASLSPPAHLQELTSRVTRSARQVSGLAAESTPPSRRPSTRPLLQPLSGGEPSPRTAAHTEGSRPKRTRHVGPHGGPLRVLAMDDDPTTLRLLHLTLKEVGGFESVVVTAAHAALHELRQREFDVVISDAMMPDMNGQEFCTAARGLGGAAARVPIIILSAATKDELEWHASLPGPVVWLRKPFMPSMLVQDVVRIAQAHPLVAT